MGVASPIDDRIGIVLINSGSPEELSKRSIRKFLRKLLSDPYLITVNKYLWFFILNFCILPRRPKVILEHYRQIWTDEGSPLLCEAASLARGVEQTLTEAGLNVVVRDAMSYANPTIPHAIRDLKEEGCTRVIALPLFPHNGISTTHTIKSRVFKAKEHLKWDVPFDFIDDYHSNPTYIKAIAASIKNAGFDVDSDDRIVFSYHSVPLSHIEAGDKYELQTGACGLFFANELGIDRLRWTTSYQSRFGKEGTWLTPETLPTLLRLAKTGKERIFVICPGFTLDCIETSYEIDIEYREEVNKAIDAGEALISKDDLVYVPCLGSTWAHVQVLIDVLKPYL